MKTLRTPSRLARAAAAVAVAAALAAAAGCVSSAPPPKSHRPEPRGRREIRPVDVYLQENYRYQFNGSVYKHDEVVRALHKPEYEGRPILLHAHPSNSDSRLEELRARFARDRLPKITIVKARHSSATASVPPPPQPRSKNPNLPPPQPPR